MSTIRETITSSVSLPYEADRYVGQVVEALTEREYTLTDQITTAVVQRFGVSEDQVREQLQKIGAEVRPAPEPEPVVDLAVEDSGADLLSTDDGEGKGKTKARVAALEERLGGIEGLLNKLVTLAENRLGARL